MKGKSTVIKKKYIFLLIVLAALCILGSFIPGFFTFTNIMNVTRQASTIAICALAMTLVLIIKGIDLGTGGVMAFCAMVSGFLMLSGMNVFLAMLIGAAVGLLIGIINGVLVSAINIPPFIATYVTGQITLGLALVVGKGTSISGLPASYAAIGNNLFLNIPINTWIMVVLLVITTIILKYTRMGKHIYALGGSESTIKTEGIDPAKVKIFCFAMCGLFSAIAGLLLSAQMATVHPTQGASYQLDAVAASLIGGVSMLGGEGAAWMSILGALIIGFLRNALDMLAIDPFYQNLVIGVAIIVVVGISVYNKNKELKAAKVF
ncbi:MAG: ABC transporter permease [Butyricicoccus sp.]